MGIDIKSFEVLYEDIVLYSVEVVDDTVRSIKRYNIVELPISLKEGMSDGLMRFFEFRCFDRNRPDIKTILRKIGVPYYNPYLICRKMHGLVAHDNTWVRFEDEQGLTYARAKADISKFGGC